MNKETIQILLMTAFLCTLQYIIATSYFTHNMKLTFKLSLKLRTDRAIQKFRNCVFSMARWVVINQQLLTHSTVLVGSRAHIRENVNKELFQLINRGGFIARDVYRATSFSNSSKAFFVRLCLREYWNINK